MVEDTPRSLVLFFYLSLLDADLCLKLSRRSADALRLVPYQSRDRATESFITETSRQFSKHPQFRINKALKSKVTGPAYIGLTSEELDAWVRFWKMATDEELLSVLWIHVLGFDKPTVARALGLSLGSMNHRLSMGLQKAGAVAREAEAARVAHV